MADVVTLRQAVAELVHDGDVVALEGFTHLIPHAAGHELIRQGRRDLTLVRMTPDVIYDQMIGMGCAGRLIFSWGGNPGVGSLHRFRDAVEPGWPVPLEIEEHSHAGMARPTRRVLPTCRSACCADTRAPTCAHAPPGRGVDCPFTGERLAAVRALRPDVGDHPRPAGRPRRQRAAVGHHRRAEGGGAFLATLDRDGRGDRGRADAPPGRGRDPVVGGDRRGPGAGRRASVLRPWLLRPRQRLLQDWDGSAATATRSAPGCAARAGDGDVRSTVRLSEAKSAAADDAEYAPAR